MLNISLHITNTDDLTGYRSPIFEANMATAGSFVSAGWQVSKIKAKAGRQIRISDIADISDITSIFIVSRSSKNNHYPIFNISFVDFSGEIKSEQSCSMFAVASMDQSIYDIVIDSINMELPDPEILIAVTTK